MQSNRLSRIIACLALLVSGSACSFEEQPLDEKPTTTTAEETVRSTRQSVVLGGTCAVNADCLATNTNSVCNTTLVCECAPCFQASGGACVPVTCAGDLCKTSSCNPGTGLCVDVPQNNGTGCDDGGGPAVFGCANTCSAGSCAGAALTCAGTDFCEDVACDATDGTCKNTPKNEALGCTPGASPTAGCGNTCVAGACTGPSQTAACNGQDDLCADYSCVPADGTCGTPVATLSTTGCQPSGGRAIIGCSGTCQANATCGGTSKTAACNTNDSRCRDATCNGTTGQCDQAALNVGAGCVDDASTSPGCAGICQSNGTCSSVPQSMHDYCSITQATGNPCTLSQCTPGTGSCSIVNLNVQCDDGAACTGTSTPSACDSGFCRGGNEVDSTCEGARPVCGISDCRAASSTNPTAGCYYTPIQANANVTCAPVDTANCKRAALCNGTDTSCPMPANANSGTPCGAAVTACGVGEIINQALCNGGGTCQTPVRTSCNGYGCTPPAGVPTCKTTCGNDTDCTSSHYCNGGSCVPKASGGTACTATNQCSTGICSFRDGAAGLGQGVCCNAVCDGTCEQCNGAGNCVAVTGPPVGDRSACGSHPFCGGNCNGTNRSSCTYLNVGQSCDAAECTSDTGSGIESYQAPINCNAAGLCPGEGSPVSCNGLVCDLAIPGCLGGCSNDQDCTVENTYCPTAGVPCAPLKTSGTSCARNDECSNGNCIDGFCCGSSCSGLCEACNVAGSEGTCRATPVGTQPVGARPDCGGAGSCAGSCGGTNRFACNFPDSSTSCGSAICTGSEATPEGSCDGGGLCATGSSVDCAPGVCTVGACDGDCSACTATQYCIANKCVEKQTNGAACVLGSDCQNGNCIDGVCCDTSCTGQCEACNVTGAEGVCSAVPNGGAPRGARTACATDGSACAGSCDGAARTTCAYPDQTTECGAPSCGTQSAKQVATLARLCQGNGTCSAVQTQVCPVIPGTCTGDLCSGDCTVDADCLIAGQYCAGGVCIDQPALGQACSRDTQCASGFCVDGICCDSACSGSCAQCGSSGVCSARTGAPLPGRTPCAGAGPCGGLCDGVATTCTTPDNTTACGTASCTGGYAVGASSCDGSGVCGAASGTVCAGGLLCDGPVCATVCVDDSDCATGLECRAGECLEPLVPPATGGTSGTGGAGGTGTGGAGTSTGGITGEGGDGGPDLIPGIDQGTCGCNLPGTGSGDTGRLWMLGLALTGLALRRRGQRLPPRAF